MNWKYILAGGVLATVPAFALLNYSNIQDAGNQYVESDSKETPLTDKYPVPVELMERGLEEADGLSDRVLETFRDLMEHQETPEKKMNLLKLQDNLHAELSHSQNPDRYLLYSTNAEPNELIDIVLLGYRHGNNIGRTTEGMAITEQGVQIHTALGNLMRKGDIFCSESTPISDSLKLPAEELVKIRIVGPSGISLRGKTVLYMGADSGNFTSHFSMMNMVVSAVDPYKKGLEFENLQDYEMDRLVRSFSWLPEDKVSDSAFMIEYSNDAMLSILNHQSPLRDQKFMLPTLIQLAKHKDNGQMVFYPVGAYHVTAGNITKGLEEKGIKYAALITESASSLLVK